MSDKITKELTNKIVNTIDIVSYPIKQRMANPLIGSFTITWVILNWKPILFFILSSKTVESKIEYINTHFYINEWFIFSQSMYMYLIIPLLTSIIYIICSQRIENLIDFINDKPLSTKRHHNHREAIKYLENQETIASQEARVLEAKTNYKTLEQKELLIQKIENDKQTLKDIEIDLNKQLTTLNGDLNTQSNLSNTLRKEYFILNEKYNNTTLVFKTLIDSILRNTSFGDFSKIENELKNTLKSNNQIDNDLKDQLLNSISDISAINNSFNSKIDLTIYVKNKLPEATYKQLVAIVNYLFDVLNSSTSHFNDNINGSYKFTIRLKHKNDSIAIDLYDTVISNIDERITKLTFRFPENYPSKSTEIKRNSGRSLNINNK